MIILRESIDYIKQLCNNGTFEIWCIDNKQDKINLYGNGTINLDKFIDYEEKLPIEAIKDEDYKYYIFSFPKRVKTILALENKDIELSQDKLDRIYKISKKVYTTELIRLKNRDIEILKDIITLGKEDIDKNQVLDNILEHSIDIVDKFNMACIQVYSKETEALKVEGIKGFSEELRNWILRPEDFVVGKVFSDGIPRFYSTQHKLVNNFSMVELDANKLKEIARLGGEEEILALAVLPIINKNKTLGIVTFFQTDSSLGSIDEDDIEYLETFAFQLGLVISNLQLKESLDKNLRQKGNIEGKVSKIDKYSELKDKLYLRVEDVDKKDYGYKDMVKSFGEILGQAMSYCYYSLIDGSVEYNNLYISKEDFENIIRDYMQNGKGRSEYKGYYFLPINDDKIELGYVITSTNIEEDPDLYQLFLESKIYFIFAIVKYQRKKDFEFKRRHYYFSKILYSPDTKDVENSLEILDINKDKKYRFILIENKANDTFKEIEWYSYKIYKDINNLFEDEIFSYMFYNRIVILISYDSINLESVENKLNSIMKKYKDEKLFVGVGGEYVGAENISKAYTESENALKFAGKNHVDIIEYDNIGINSLFVNHSPMEIENFINDILGPLRTEEGKRSNLEETLFTYVKLNKSAIKTSEKLYIHINTLYKRLEKIEELLEVDFENPEDNLKIQLSCHLATTNYKMEF